MMFIVTLPPLHKDENFCLFCSLIDLQCLKWRNFSVDVCWMNNCYVIEKHDKGITRTKHKRNIELVYGGQSGSTGEVTPCT